MVEGMVHRGGWVTNNDNCIDYASLGVFVSLCICDFSNTLYRLYDFMQDKVSRGGGYSDLGWVRMCGPEFQLLPYSKTWPLANSQPISKPHFSTGTHVKTNQCHLPPYKKTFVLCWICWIMLKKYPFWKRQDHPYFHNDSMSNSISNHLFAQFNFSSHGCV